MKRKLKILPFCLVAVIAIPLLLYCILESCMGECINYKSTSTRATLQAMRGAVNMFKLDTGRYPTQQKGLEALVQKPEGVEGWAPGGYLDTQYVPLDSWRNEFIYIFDPNSSPPFEIISLGADGKPGGSGENADLSSLNNW